MSKKTMILKDWDILQRTKRIAYQILENNYDEKEIHFIGIKNQGYRFAEELTDYLKSISKVKIHLHSLSINKRDPLAKPIILSVPAASLTGKVVILVDDVANTGRTVFYAFQPLMHIIPKKLQVTVLVDRKHKRYPVCSDFVGLSLSTTIRENIEVEFGPKKKAAYLS